MPRFGEGFEGVPPCPKQGINLDIAVVEANFVLLSLFFREFCLWGFCQFDYGFLS